METTTEKFDYFKLLNIEGFFNLPTINPLLEKITSHFKQEGNLLLSLDNKYKVEDYYLYRKDSSFVICIFFNKLEDNDYLACLNCNDYYLRFLDDENADLIEFLLDVSY